MDEQQYQTTPVKQKNQPIWLAALAATALISGGLGGGIGAAVVAGQSPETSVTQQTAQQDKTSGTTTVSHSNSDLASIVEAKTPSVVTVSVTTNDGSGTGSGVVVDEEGHIVTNAHVATLSGLTKNGKISIQTSTGQTAEATLVGVDSTSDLAVLKTSLKGLKPIRFASSSELKVGDETIAIGSPLGLNSTVTTGIVSALNRPITVESSEIRDAFSPSQQSVALNVIQTDAAINSGNSGGALLNSNGDLVGINVAIASTGQNTGSIGVGFAIPSNLVKQVVKDLITTGERVHGFLGVGVDDNYGDSSSGFVSGAVITNVETGSPAADVGIKPGDVVVEVNSEPVKSATQFVALIKQNQPGSKIEISVERDGKMKKITVDLTEQGS